MGICSGNAGNDKGFVDIHPVADRINNFEHAPPSTAFEGSSGSGHSPKD